MGTKGQFPSRFPPPWLVLSQRKFHAFGAQNNVLIDNFTQLPSKQHSQHYYFLINMAKIVGG